MRTIVDIPEEELRELDELSARLGISRAEAVRRAVRDYIEQDESAFDEAFGMWKHRGEDGLAYQQRMRSEWEGRGGGL